MSELATPIRADRRLFSLHEEEEVTEVPARRRQVFYFETHFRALLPDRFVGANLAVYWVPGQLQEPWVGPDVFVSAHRPADPEPRIYLVWEDGPLSFVGEVASERTRRSERKKREETYREALQIPEYLYVDLDRNQLDLWRLQEAAYRRVRPQNGRLYSQELDLWFGWGHDERFVRIWTADGRMLPTQEEQRRLVEEAEQRAAEADQRARRAEQRAAELAAELERLRRGGNA